MKQYEFKPTRITKVTRTALSLPWKSVSAIMLAGALFCAPAQAVQMGGIKGKVSGGANSGVTVTATSDVMPKARSVITNDNGSYSLPLLIPGTYELTFTGADGSEKKVSVEVLLDRTSKINMSLAADSSENVLQIVGSSVIVIKEGDSSLSNSLSAKDIANLPVGQDYRDLFKLIPGVQYSENSVLGPSAGGSGRDNSYGFDGVDVSLPMFGNLSSEPSTHDIQSVSIDRGGAKAVGFNRSGGFAINTISKSGTNEFHGNLEYKGQPKNFVARKDDTDHTAFQTDKNWIVASIGGPIIEDELFFYTSFYRPELSRVNKSTAYGPAKDFSSIREEYFGKITYAPTEDALINVSYRTSDNTATGSSVGAFDADSTSSGSFANQDIFSFEGSYIIDDYTTFSMQYSTYDLVTRSGPDTLFSNVIPRLGDPLDLNNLDQLGAFNVPVTSTSPGYDNVGAQALIDQYGYIDANGVRQGGGQIGGGSTINDQNFYRDSFEMSLDHEMDFGSTFHRMHFGFKWADGTEVLSRASNGWGSINYIGGLELASDGVTPVYYRTITQQMSLQDANGATTPGITSRTESFNFEFNDTIEDGDFTYNLGLLISHDVLYGQGLKANSANVSGFELAPGHEYEMYSIDWKDMIQPRLGVTWQFDERSTVFANFASYNPEASSLARAASWARNTRRSLNVDFDAAGNLIESQGRAGSSGKFFQKGIKPRRIDELTFGYTKAVSEQLYVRAHIRRREGAHFWEDTWNYSRDYGTYGPWGGVPAHLRNAGPYIPELPAYRAEVGGSSYVIAELDDAYTSYNEFSVEAEYKEDNYYLNASYVLSHYYGNFDQDAVSSNVDANLFIGSSSLADGRGRQLWDGKEGNLLGDKRHLFKMYGYYTTDWKANIGANLIYQSGDVWEPWNGAPYGYSSSTIRNVDSAGSRRSPSHWQMDVNYTQNYELNEDYSLQFRADIFNLFDNQTGYSINPYQTSATFGQPRRLFAPRRIQLSLNLTF